MDDRPEERLVDEAQRGGREAFAELVRRHERRIYGVVYRMAGNHADGDDLAQEVFLTAWRSISSFERGSSFYTWVYRIAVNRSLTFLKNKKYIYKYPTVFTVGGRRKPAVNVAIQNAINQGTLLLNFSGHGKSAALDSRSCVCARDRFPASS